MLLPCKTKKNAGPKSTIAYKVYFKTKRWWDQKIFKVVYTVCFEVKSCKTQKFAGPKDTIAYKVYFKTKRWWDQKIFKVVFTVCFEV